MATKLAEITTQYHTFEDNQVLTKDQLNEFINYFEDQDRMSRIFLSGVGIACGFELSYDSGKPSITISQGAGVTTDGDLIKLRKNIDGSSLKSIDLSSIEYTHYKPFEDGFANYKFFKKLVVVDGKVTEVPIEMFELLSESAENASPLSSFAKINVNLSSKLIDPSLIKLKDISISRFTEIPVSGLNNMVVLLYLEAYPKKPICVLRLIATTRALNRWPGSGFCWFQKPMPITSPASIPFTRNTMCSRTISICLK